MTNLEKLVRDFCQKNKNPFTKQCIAGDIACRMIDCENCPVAGDNDGSASCFIRLSKWAMKEANNA